ncbi:MAG: aldo/keto reductase [Spirochaetales bacterium]|nr:aldo/keto reductase [Spirochaetales bacterium]
MKYEKISGIKKKVSRIAQGTVLLKVLGKSNSFRILDAALAEGINIFDSAHTYFEGESDRIFGEWVESRGIREEIILLDKGAYPNTDRNRLTPFDITADLYDCLARLKFDYLDIFALHRDDESVPVGPIIEILNTHIKNGLIRAIGASNWTSGRIKEANEYAAEHGLAGFTLSSPHYSLAEQYEDPWGYNSVTLTGDTAGRAREWYRKTQMPVFSWSTLCGGFFSGKYSRDNLDTFIEEKNKRVIRCYGREPNFKRLDRCLEIATVHGATPSQIAVGWVLSGRLNCFPLIGSWTPEQVRQNAAASEIELTDSEVEYLNLEINTY